MSYLSFFSKASLVSINLLSLYANPMNFSSFVRIGRLLHMVNINMNTLYYYGQSFLDPVRPVNENEPKPIINLRSNLYVFTDIIVQTIIHQYIATSYILERLETLVAAAVELQNSTKYLNWQTKLSIINAYSTNLLIPIFITSLASYCVYYAFVVYDNKCVKLQDVDNAENQGVKQQLLSRSISNYRWVPVVGLACSVLSTMIAGMFVQDYFCHEEIKFIFGLKKNYAVTTPVFDVISQTLISLTADCYTSIFVEIGK